MENLDEIAKYVGYVVFVVLIVSGIAFWFGIIGSCFDSGGHLPPPPRPKKKNEGTILTDTIVPGGIH